MRTAGYGPRDDVACAGGGGKHFHPCATCHGDRHAELVGALYVSAGWRCTGAPFPTARRIAPHTVLSVVTSASLTLVQRRWIFVKKVYPKTSQNGEYSIHFY